MKNLAFAIALAVPATAFAQYDRDSGVNYFDPYKQPDRYESRYSQPTYKPRRDPEPQQLYYPYTRDMPNGGYMDRETPSGPHPFLNQGIQRHDPRYK